MQLCFGFIQGLIQLLSSTIAGVNVVTCQDAVLHIAEPCPSQKAVKHIYIQAGSSRLRLPIALNANE